MIRRILNIKETIFYVFKQDDIYAIYQHSDKMEEPLYHGRRNMYESYIKKIKELNKSPKIYYYEIEKNGSMKLNPFFSHNIV